MSRMAPAVKKRPRKPSDAPVTIIPISIRSKSVARLTLTTEKHSSWLPYRVAEMRIVGSRGKKKSLVRRCAPAVELGLLPVDSKSVWCPKSQWEGTMR
jgi:hypothetical protein